jgi:succinate dehydrogenase / fumarate reductase cytochrome b subunit
MSIVAGILKSSLGKKYIMAGTGVLLILFLLGHLAGNLQIFGPPELINHYAMFLHSKPALVWGARLGLLVVVTLHIMTAAHLVAANKAARPVGYAGGEAYGSTWQSRYMLMSGIVILSFIIYHLLHFTALLPGINGVGDFRHLETELDGAKVHDVYAMIILGFQVWWVSAFYIIAQALLFVHLSHGISSAFQSFGFRNYAWWPRIQLLAKAGSMAVFVGYAIIPVAIYLRVIGGDYADKVRADLKTPAQVQPAATAAPEKETH